MSIRHSTSGHLPHLGPACKTHWCSVLLWAVCCMMLLPATASFGQPGQVTYSWHADDRAEKVMRLIPGQAVRGLTPDNLFAEWTAAQVEKWNQANPPLEPTEAYRLFAETSPTDAELIADFPRLIAPYGKVISGQPEARKAAQVMITYCPFCGAWHGYYERLFRGFLELDQENAYHAVTTCCGKDLYAREQDFPADYDLRYDRSAEFAMLDDSIVQVAAASYTDYDGVQWELYIPNMFAYQRWQQLNGMVLSYMRSFKESGNPLAAHKIAVILDYVADTYYALPLAQDNELAAGKDGRPLTRAEWEAVPRPSVFEYSYLRTWNRRNPTHSRGWLNPNREHIWVEPFARVRHHPAFKQYSQVKYGDSEALDRKIGQKLLRELVMMFKSCNAFLLKIMYQEANYTDMMLLGILAEDDFLFDFAAANQELTLYNHHHHDGLNQQGAPNYMRMLLSYYNFMSAPEGWLEFEPDLLESNPFFAVASTELHRLGTVRGIQVEFGDQHIYPFRSIITDDEQVAENERLGSMNWPGYGVGIVRVGGPGQRQEVVLTYDKVSLHGKSDTLGIQCWVDGIPVMRAGGYAVDYHGVVLDESRPEIQAFLALPYPREVAATQGWSRIYSDSPMAQNSLTVDDTATTQGHPQDNEGFGELITFKGGEAAGEPGAAFQVLDVRDHHSFERVGIPGVNNLRRTLLGVEGRDGRPYVVDIITLSGGKTHTLYQSAWAERAEDRLPAAVSRAENLAVALFDEETAAQPYHAATYARIRQVERLGPAPESWEVTWKTDYAAYAPRDSEGGPFQRPLPEDVGRVRLRLIGLDQPGETELIRAKGPFIPWIRQPLPEGKEAYGYVAFMDANDFLIERRSRAENGQDSLLHSSFVHILEGLREGDSSVITGVQRLTPAAGPETAVALRLDLAAGHSDTVVFQPDPSTLRLNDGLETDAHYALLRRDDQGEVLDAHMVRGTFLNCGDFSVTSPGDYTATIVDLVGDLTGTRMESALIVRPDGPWATGDALAGKQLLIEATNTLRPDSNEGYIIERVTELPDGLLRLDLAKHAPFATGWHQVTELGTAGPNSLRTNRTFSAGVNTSWVWGLKVWFPRTDHTYTFRRTDPFLAGAHGAALLEVAEDVDLAAEGIKLGDWFVVYFVEPGQKVSVASEVSWQRSAVAGRR